MIQGYLVEYDIGLSFHFQSTPKNISFPVIDKVKAGFMGTIKSKCSRCRFQFHVCIKFNSLMLLLPTSMLTVMVFKVQHMRA